MPGLRAFAVSLAGSFHQADDLLQETLLKAWSSSDSFTPGTNMRAWLFTILRNTYYSLYRRRGREVQDTDGVYSGRIATPPNQEGALDIADFQAALAKLPPEHRDVLLMVGASGFSYEEAAEICGVAVGTVKSRLNRARARLAEVLGITEASDLGPDGAVQAVVKNRTFRNEACERLHEDGESATARVMSLIVIPVAAGIVLIAYSGYAAEVRDVRAIQATAANGRAQVVRSWLDAVGRALSDQAAAAAFLSAGPCTELAQGFIRRNADYAVGPLCRRVRQALRRRQDR